MKIRKKLFVFAALALAAPTLFAAGGGTVVLVEGKVLIERGGVDYPAAKAAAIRSGDTLKIGSLGTATVQFEDDSVFTIPGPAAFKVDEFSMPKPGSGGKASYTLREGGLSTVTGRIGPSRKGEYALRAEEATMTVEGTAYAAIRCYGECAKRFKAGLYVRGVKGVVLMTNTAGSLKLRRGQTGYAASKNTLAIHAKSSPFNDPTIAAAYGIMLEFEGEVHPPRIEQEPPASPS